MKTIRVKTGQLVTVDDEDAAWLKRFTWRVAPNGYVYTTMYLHRLVLKVPRKKQVNHIDENKLHNWKANLEPMSPQQNTMHSWALRQSRRWGKQKSSKFVGVSRQRGRSKWIAVLKSNGKQKYLGTFHNEEAAALAYNNAAKKAFGRLAYQNSIQV